METITSAINSFFSMSVPSMIGQILSIIGMIINILSYQGKKQRDIIMMQFIGAVVFTVSFFLLGGITGALLNMVCMARGLVFSNKKFFHADKIGWVFGFIGAFLVMYVLTFAVFGKEPTVLNLIIEFIPVIGASVFTFGFFMKDAKAVRRLALVNSPCWLAYDIITVSVGGIICEVISLISIFVGMLRHDIEKKNK